jgi:hypothetical protein
VDIVANRTVIVLLQSFTQIAFRAHKMALKDSFTPVAMIIKKRNTPHMQGVSKFQKLSN